jgi:hypothetical protein
MKKEERTQTELCQNTELKTTKRGKQTIGRTQ